MDRHYLTHKHQVHMLEKLFTLSDQLIRVRDRTYQRQYFTDLTQNRFSILVGQRGVGKTTLLVQHLKKSYPDYLQSRKAIYVQADHFLVKDLSLYAIAERFDQLGGEFICFDEIHKYPDWSRELKSITDTFPALKVLASGSSILEIHKGSHDLSRRAIIYRLPGLSFREFLEFRHGMVFQVIPMNELLEFNRTPGAEVLSRIRPLQYFDEYLAHGYYPYENDKPALYAQEVMSMLNRVLTEDFSAVHRIDYESVLKIRRVIAILAEAGPLKPNIEKLAAQSGTTRDSLLKFLKYLHRAGIIAWLTKGNEDINYFNKPDRLLLNDTCLFRALSAEQSNQRHLLEAFMLSQLQVSCQINLIYPGRYLIDLLYEFEMTWVKPKGRVVKSNNNAYILSPDAESSSRGVIPLWMIGFSY